MNSAVVINGSPRVDKGNTVTVLGHFVEGMVDAGLQVEVLHASRLKVNPCSCGMMYCWYRKPGECLLNDDMQSLYPKLRASDLLVLATPVYIPLPGGMQDIINRLCPLVMPLLESRAGRTRARFREGVQIKKFALVSTGGWWELGNFDTVVRIVEELAHKVSVDFAGAVLRPHAFMLKRDGELTAEGEDVLNAVRKAGYELVKDGTMRQETLDAISRPLISEDEMQRMYNSWCK